MAFFKKWFGLGDKTPTPVDEIEEEDVETDDDDDDGDMDLQHAQQLVQNKNAAYAASVQAQQARSMAQAARSAATPSFIQSLTSSQTPHAVAAQRQAASAARDAERAARHAEKVAKLVNDEIQPEVAALRAQEATRASEMAKEAARVAADAAIAAVPMAQQDEMPTACPYRKKAKSSRTPQPLPIPVFDGKNFMPVEKYMQKKRMRDQNMDDILPADNLLHSSSEPTMDQRIAGRRSHGVPLLGFDPVARRRRGTPSSKASSNGKKRGTRNTVISSRTGHRIAKGGQWHKKLCMDSDNVTDCNLFKIQMPGEHRPIVMLGEAHFRRCAEDPSAPYCDRF